MIKETHSAAEKRMKNSVEALQTALSKLRTGRAHPSLVDGLRVDYYGSETPLAQVASITVADARTLLIAPWEKTLVQAIEKAIMSADLGLNPVTVGTDIRVPLPPLTEERRRDLVKVMKQEAENARVSVRNTRRDANQQIKELAKGKTITEDEGRQAEDGIQRLTDRFVAELDKLLAAKEAEILEV